MKLQSLTASEVDAYTSALTAADADYLLALPWFAVSDPDEPTPLYDALTAEHAAKTPRRDARGRFVPTNKNRNHR